MNSPDTVANSLPTSLSRYLNFWRVASCLVVLYSHGMTNLFTLPRTAPHLKIAHEAVVVFFVISGFVIATVHAGHENRPLIFLLKRISRIYSVLIPSVLIILTMDAIGWRIRPAYYEFQFNAPWHWKPIVASLFFQGENWFRQIRLGSTGAIWSLHYEVWYYVLFGSAVFIRAKAAKAAALLLILIWIGPKILMLLPCWLVGVAAMHANPIRLTRPKAFAAVVMSLLVFLTLFFRTPFKIYTFTSMGPIPLCDSRYFIGDWFLSMAFGFHLFAVKCLLISRSSEERAIPFWVSPLNRFAGTTFTLYLVHQSILRVCGAILGFPTDDAKPLLLSMGITLVLGGTCGYFIEPLSKPLYRFLYGRMERIRLHWTHP